MTELEKIVLTSVFTILGGISVYVAGQLLSKLIIEPLLELRKAIGEVRFNLAFHAATIHTPMVRSPEVSDKARDALMKSSCDLFKLVDAIPMYAICTRLLPSRFPETKVIDAAAIQLRGLSTYVHDTGQDDSNDVDVIGKRVVKIEKLLRLTAGVGPGVAETS